MLWEAPFKYIICSYSTSAGGRERGHHHPFKYIICSYSTLPWPHMYNCSLHLNTSYVPIQHLGKNLCRTHNAHLNTSYVPIQHVVGSAFMTVFGDLNTSYVPIQPPFYRLFPLHYPSKTHYFQHISQILPATIYIFAPSSPCKAISAFFVISPSSSW